MRKPVCLKLHVIKDATILSQEALRDDHGRPAGVSVFMPRADAPGAVTYSGPSSKARRVGVYYVPQQPWPKLVETVLDGAAAVSEEEGASLPDWQERQSWAITSQGDHVRVPLFPLILPREVKGNPPIYLVHGMQAAFALQSLCPVEVSEIDLFIGKHEHESDIVCYFNFVFREKGT